MQWRPMSMLTHPVTSRRRPDMTRSDSRISPAAAQIPQHQQPSRKRTILVVDDEKDLVDLVTYTSSATLRCPGALDGTEAIELAQRHVPDLVILDLMLPRIDGTEVARRLKSDSR